MLVNTNTSFHRTVVCTLGLCPRIVRAYRKQESNAAKQKKGSRVKKHNKKPSGPIILEQTGGGRVYLHPASVVHRYNM